MKTERVQLLVTWDVAYETKADRRDVLRQMRELAVGPAIFGTAYRAETKRATVVKPPAKLKGIW